MGEGGTVTDYAVILTHNRPELLKLCMAAISPQVDRVVVVDNASSPPVRIDHDWAMNAELLHDPVQPPSLGRMWNDQLQRISYAEQWDDHPWNVAVLCDDAIAPAGWFAAVRDGMRSHDAAAACTHAIAPVTVHQHKTAPDSDIFNRMTGWAFMLAGEKNVRADESMLWWWVDSSLDWTARQNGGMVICPGPVVPNERMGTWTNVKPELAEQAGRDRLAFAAKWGHNPW